MATERKPWEIPAFESYVEPPRRSSASESTEPPPERTREEVEELLSRPERSGSDRTYECTDTTPIDYSRGPHDREIDINEKDYADY